MLDIGRVCFFWIGVSVCCVYLNEGVGEGLAISCFTCHRFAFEATLMNPPPHI